MTFEHLVKACLAAAAALVVFPAPSRATESQVKVESSAAQTRIPGFRTPPNMPSGGPLQRVMLTLSDAPLLRAALVSGAFAARFDQPDGARLSRGQQNGTRRRLGDRAGLVAEAGHRSIERRLLEVGGEVVDHDLLTGTVIALVPRSALDTIGQWPEVARVEAAVLERELRLELSTRVVGAPSMWNVGYAGGLGHNDTVPADLAILHDKIEEEHPAFRGVKFQRPAGAPLGTACGQHVAGCEHGTEVASMAISRGARDCSVCVAADALAQGIAVGLDTVLDAQASSPSVDDKAWALGIGSFGVAGASDPAEVLSDSHGSIPVADDSGALQRVDKIISAYGALIAYPAGNEGPARTVNQSCIAYDTLCMGGFTPRGTVDPADDVVEDFSSRGPTPGGRKKPDLVAVSTSEFANQHWIRDGRLWSGGSGTSLAAPQGAAAAALLAGSGIAAPIAQKAILINSARQGRATPSSSMGTQTGWQPDWGWGALNLEAAAQERTHFYTAEVPRGEAHFYRADVQAAGERATLVWNRRALGCISPGCDTTTLTLTNLDLDQLDPSTGTLEARSASAIDNVEQVRSPTAGPVIYKVKASSAVDGLPGEPYALAARRQITPLATPRARPRVTLSTSVARPGDAVHVVAEVTNPSGDLSGESVTAALELPPGVESAPGSAPITQGLGTLNPGASATVSWTVRATGDAANRIRVRTSASRYGETFSSEDAATFTSDGTPPSVTIAAPTGTVSEATIPVSWSGRDDGVGVRDHTVEVSVDGGPFVPWLTATAATSATYAGAPGSSYRFRARDGQAGDHVGLRGVGTRQRRASARPDRAPRHPAHQPDANEPRPAHSGPSRGAGRAWTSRARSRGTRSAGSRWSSAGRPVGARSRRAPSPSRRRAASSSPSAPRAA